MPSPTVRRYLLSTLLVVALVAFGYYALQPVREACALNSGPYGSIFTPDNVHASGDGHCGEVHRRFQAWLGR